MMRRGSGIILVRWFVERVEETLNAMLDAEADRLCGAGRYERNEARQGILGMSFSSVIVSVPRCRN